MYHNLVWDVHTVCMKTYEDRVRVPQNTKYLRKNPTETGLCTPSHTPAVVQFRYSLGLRLLDYSAEPKTIPCSNSKRVLVCARVERSKFQS